MASQTNWFGESFRAQVAQALPQRFITLDSTGRIRLAQANEYSEGVLENLPVLEDMPASCSFVGLTKVAVDGAYAIGTFLVPGTDGIGTQASTATYPYVRAKMLEASQNSGDIVSIRLVDEVVGSGVTGAFGFTGVQGTQGNTGIMGMTGVVGATGDQGVTGIALGETGVQGLVGDTGIQGLSITGGTGIQGETGVQWQGETGVQGQSITGGTGIQGETGVQGGTGIQGTVSGYSGDIFGVTGIYTCTNGLVVSVL